MRLNTIQKLTVVSGTLGVILNTLGLTTGIEQLNYISILIGRVSGLLYVVSIDKFYWWLLTPLSISLTNSFLGLPELLFLENLVQSVIYQVSAILTFKKVNEHYNTY